MSAALITVTLTQAQIDLIHCMLDMELAALDDDDDTPLGRPDADEAEIRATLDALGVPR